MVEEISLKAWGNSYGIRIPKKFMEAMNIKKDDLIHLELSDDAIIIKKAFRHKTFEERLAEYNGQISVEEFDWGEPKGREQI